ncbi:Acid-sensing ion channel 1 [Araneus ventricosus]|uniref:Acid-sensing ion channel 1 n=1 Tax=Araneus ventricosus TaxID=182803 RepID=A0A4Y2CDV7_ARAVE|nr:Acid-sensing ion channel 1 [Araneus ventricosus]
MIHRQWGGATNYHRLLSTYVNQTTTHGVRKITTSRHPARKFFWILVFLTSLGGCCYHCSYLIGNYLSNPKVTITQEKDADFVEFPALTVCNLNVIKKDYAHQYFEMASSRRLKGSPGKANVTATKAPNTCYQSEAELLQKSAVDLSDTWLSLGVTKDNLSEFGHKAEDLIIQCTFNSKDCFGNNTTFYVKITNVTSPIFGLCHTLSVKKNDTDKAMTIKKGGTTQGIRLTLNIERSEYWDLISAEYGVRLLVHPQGTFPTMQRGGIIASPGRSVHVGVKRRLTKLLPGYEGSCTETFLESPIRKRLKSLHLDFDLENLKYTYEVRN